MKYFFFYSEDDNFQDILNDKIIKKSIVTKISYYQYLILGFDEGITEGIISYMLVKYGDQVKTITDIIPDRTPISNKDYRPDKKWENGKFVDN